FPSVVCFSIYPERREGSLLAPMQLQGECPDSPRPCGSGVRCFQLLNYQLTQLPNSSLCPLRLKLLLLTFLDILRVSVVGFRFCFLFLITIPLCSSVSSVVELLLWFSLLLLVLSLGSL